jgi:hypothetical protein
LQPNSINLFNAGSEWIAVLTEDGVETRRSFTVRQHAVNWLEGQCVRSGLPVDAIVSVSTDLQSPAVATDQS